MEVVPDKYHLAEPYLRQKERYLLEELYRHTEVVFLHPDQVFQDLDLHRGFQLQEGLYGGYLHRIKTDHGDNNFHFPAEHQNKNIQQMCNNCFNTVEIK